MTTNAMQQSQSRAAALHQTLSSNEERIMELVGGDATRAKRLINSALIMASEDPKVMACEPRSIARAVIQAAMVGANLTKGTGQGYIVPFGNKATFLDGYRLWLSKMTEAGYEPDAQVVRLQDDFTYTAAPLRLEHTYDPFDSAEDRGPIRGAYAVAYRLGANGERVLVNAVAISMDELDKAREDAKKRNRGRESPAWKLWGDQMYLRLPIKRLAKKLDLRESEGLKKLLEIDAQDGGPDPDVDRAEDLEVAPASDLSPGYHGGFGFTPEASAAEISKELGEPEVIPEPDWEEAERQALKDRGAP